MRRATPTFLSEAMLGLGFSLVTAALTASLAGLAPGDLVVRGVLAVTALAYVLLGLARCPLKAGKAVAFGAWAIAAGALWLLGPPLGVYIAIHVALIWLIRSLHAYSSLLAAAADLLLCALSLAVAVWALEHSGSLFLGAWCFFLAQALHVTIPRLGLTRQTAPEPDRFGRAHRTAEAALRRLARNSK